jgi:hypothetical protein
MVVTAGIVRQDVIIRVVDYRVDPLFELLATKEAHAVKCDAQ